MSIVTKVGRKSWPVATFLLVSYVLLTVGAISMIVPFLIMLTSSMANEWDYEQFRILPTWLWNDRQLYMKFVAEKYLDARPEFPRDFRVFSAAYRPSAKWRSFRGMREDDDFLATGPYRFGGDPATAKRVHDDYVEWLDGYNRPLQTLPMFGRFTKARYQEFMQDLYETRFLDQYAGDPGDLSAEELERGALDVMAATWQEAKFKHFFFVTMGPSENYPYHLRIWLPPLDEQRLRDYQQFAASLPADWRVPITAQHLWVRFLENAGGPTSQFNERTGLDIATYNDVPLPDAEPENAFLAELYRTFMAERWPFWMVELPADYAPRWRDYLRQRAKTLDRLNRLVKRDYAAWEDVPFTGGSPVNPLERNFWRDYLQQLPGEELAEHRVFPEAAYRDFLRARYGTIDAVNQAYGWQEKSFDAVLIPLATVDYGQFLESRGWLRWQFLTFNFRRVFSFMAIQGRAVWTTLILVTLSILSCLTVNPLAAYALSRFNLKHTQKLLIFLLATMAFPHEVSMIPNFLLLRELGLLNTFAALVLPGLANGFAIFLLKGFFDSLPRELYEAATIDGANELTMFTRITLPLCKPILAYQALLAFIAAYGGFMWAFLVCQDSKMWTIMVWIYQYQQEAAGQPYMVMAAFVLASIPTLIVFVFCQKIILRGIIIPTMK